MSMIRRYFGDELGEPATHRRRRTGRVQRACQQVDDVAVATEVGEVLEGEVDGTAQRARAAQRPELVELSLAAGHHRQLRLNGG
jgi:hypothetical protein